MRKTHFVGAVLAVLLCGCGRPAPDKYDLIEITNRLSKVYEINHETGDALLVSGDVFNRVRSDNSSSFTNAPLSTSCSVLIQLANTNLTVVSSVKHEWRNGQLKYIVCIPYTQDLWQSVSQNAGMFFDVEFYDGGGFKVASADARFSTKSVFSDGRGGFEFVDNDSVFCALSDYQEINSVGVYWGGLLPFQLQALPAPAPVTTEQLLRGLPQ